MISFATRFRLLLQPELQIIRFGVFAALVLVMYRSLYRLTLTHGTDWVGRENGPVEASQALLGLASAVCLFIAGKVTPIGRTGMWASGALVLYACARECDQLFESYLFDDAYQWLVGLPLLVIGVAVLWSYRDQLVSDATWLMKQPSAAMFLVAGVYLATVCQVIDRPMLWSASGVDAALLTSLKTLIEELCELFAYAMLAYAGLEAMILAQRLSREALRTDMPLRLVVDGESHHAA
jgi:hypothetical protein